MSEQKSAIDAYLQAKQKGESVRQEALSVLNAIRELATAIMSVAALSGELFLHQRFGVRYLNLVTVILNWLLIAVMYQLAEGADQAGDQLFFLLLYLLFIIIVPIRMIEANRFFQSGGERHSRCSGVPHPWLWNWFTPFGHRFTNEQLVKYIEPAMLLAVAGVLGLVVGPWSARLVALAGIGMFVHRVLDEYRLRQQVFDHFDQVIESKAFEDAVDERDGQGVHANAGFVVPSSIRDAVANRNRSEPEAATSNREGSAWWRVDRHLGRVVGLFPRYPVSMITTTVLGTGLLIGVGGFGLALLAVLANAGSGGQVP